MAAVKCPTCGQTFDSEKSPAMPFCSSRCRQIDLGRWLNEDISIPLNDPEEWESRGDNGHDDDDED
jgi:endogenous inhibitor of DNA gyrase (YacG/DUF329 family)